MANMYGLEVVPGLMQVFVLRGEHCTPRLIMVKVVDDFLFANDKDEVRRFHAVISKRVHVSQFTESGALVFNRLHKTQHENGNIELSMEEYMDTIDQLALSKERRKERNALATNEELKYFIGLTGK